jgi:hypothetical protein
MSGASGVLGSKPFRFNGADFYTKEELARAFAASEEPWVAPSDYLRFIRRWLESNLEFEEATDIGDAIAKTDPEITLFRFIHSNARIPFGVWGHIISLDNLHIFLWRVTREEASQAEGRIVRMLEDGKLASLYGEYADFGEPDPVFGELLRLLKGEPPDIQLGYVAAMREPEAHVWPKDADEKTPPGRLECMKLIHSSPLRLEKTEDIKSRYAIPDEIWAMLETRGTYACGADRLNMWETKELLIPKPPDDAAYRHLSAEGYERVAKVRLWGHTVSALKQLLELEESISAFNTQRPNQVFDDAIKELESVKNRKISLRDRGFINAVSALFSKRREMMDNRRRNWAVYGISGAAILAAGRVALGLTMDWSNWLWAFCGFALLVVTVLFLSGAFGFVRDILSYSKSLENQGCYRLSFFLIATVFSLVSLSARMMNAFSYGFPLLGAPWGAWLSDRLYNRNMEKNGIEIMDACLAYSRAGRTENS